MWNIEICDRELFDAESNSRILILEVLRTAVLEKVDMFIEIESTGI